MLTAAPLRSPNLPPVCYAARPDLSRLSLPPGWQDAPADSDEPPSPLYRALVRRPQGPDPRITLQLDNRDPAPVFSHLTIELPNFWTRSVPADRIVRRHDVKLWTIHDFMVEFNMLCPRYPDQGPRPADFWLEDFLEFQLLRRACAAIPADSPYREAAYADCANTLNRLRRNAGFGPEPPISQPAAATKPPPAAAQTYY